MSTILEIPAGIPTGTPNQGIAGTSPLTFSHVTNRDGEMRPFDPARIGRAIDKAFRADQGLKRGSPFESRLEKLIERLVGNVVEELMLVVNEGSPDVEQIQDLVERVLMEHGHYTVARKYIVYREERAKAGGYLQSSAEGSS